MNKIILLGVIAMLQPTVMLADEPSPTGPVSLGVVSVHKTWIKIGKADAIMFTGYATFKSSASNRWILKSVSARNFRLVMIHRTVLQAGEPLMVLQGLLNIRAGEKIVMSDQGYHLMFVGPTRKFKNGDVVKVRLAFENQAPININFPVLKKAPK